METLIAQERVALLISRILRMLTTIELEDQPASETHEISNVEIDRHLTPKLVADEAMSANNLP